MTAHTRLAARVGALRAGPRAPRRTVRLKLTLLYGALFLVSGGILLTITNVVVRNSTAMIGVDGRLPVAVTIRDGPPPSWQVAPATLRGNRAAIAVLKTTQKRLTAAQLQADQIRGKFKHVVTVAQHQPSHELHQLLVTSLLALAVMAVVSIGLGWLVAGRVLRPLRTITAAARDISASNLHQRLASTGPTTSCTTSAARSTRCSPGWRHRSKPSASSSPTPHTNCARRSRASAPWPRWR